MEQPETGGLNAPKHAGGRPRLDIAVNEVLDSLSKGNTVSQTAKMLGIPRQAVYRAIHSSSTGTLKKTVKEQSVDQWVDQASFGQGSEGHRLTSDGSIRD